MSDASASGQRKVADTAEDLYKQLRLGLSVVKARVGDVDRVAVLAYDSEDGLLKSFFSSNGDSAPSSVGSFALSQLLPLKHLASSARGTDSPRCWMGSLATSQADEAMLSPWHREHHTSVVVPLYDGESLSGFLLFDAIKPQAFTWAQAEALSELSEFVGAFFVLQRRLMDGVSGAVKVAVELARTRDFETGQHLERIAYYSGIMARALQATHGLTDEFVEHLRVFAPLHDIGKIGVPDHILRKPGRLDPMEYEIIKQHVRWGEEIIRRMTAELSLEGSPQERMIRNIVSTHHERGDGSGYPRGLTMAQIPMEGRIVAVADVYDALSNPRAYKPAWEESKVSAELRAQAQRGQLDSDCVEALLAAEAEREAIKLRFADAKEPGEYA
jgi:HD-GYP domain-containing protein (c-di-GMP phosphodiesterase class II)